MNRLVFKVVDSADVANRSAPCAHQNGVSDGFVADEFHSWKKGAFDDSRGTENGALPGDDVGRSINSLNLFFGDPFDFTSLGLGVGKPHAELDLAPEGAEGRGGEDSFWRSTDADIKINA